MAFGLFVPLSNNCGLGQFIILFVVPSRFSLVVVLDKAKTFNGSTGRDGTGIPLPANDVFKEKSERIQTFCEHPSDKLFLTFSVLVANPKKLFFLVDNPARGLLNRGKKKICPPPPPPPAPDATRRRIF